MLLGGIHRSAGGRMTTRKHLKRRVRARAALTGESYSAALRSFRRDPQEVAMSDTDLADEPVLASCSFCKKDNRQVKRLIAGPGVYICDECVALCDQLVDQETTPEPSAARREQFTNRSAAEILGMLPGLARTAAEVEGELHRWVLSLRALGTTWAAIAGALEVDEDVARDRFAPG
jgi:ClpX C4-type zinc finger